ncbi:MAG: clostripain-related cysteine peptidase, partial [candidate division WOR-3 bacterium]
MKHLRVAVTAVAVLGAMIGSDCNIFGKGKAKWTIIAYYDGNCDLDLTKNGTSWVIAEAQEIEKVGSTDNVHVVAMVGSLKTGGQCKYYHLEKHENELPDQLRSPILENLGTKDMSDKTTLKNFITYARQKYPAEHYMLMLKDHGGGWRGAMIDAQNGAGSMMTLPDLASAMDTFHFDIVAFDACLMGMVEVAYELRQRANYLVASQFVTYAGTYGGAEWLGWLAANPNCSPLDLAKKIVEACLNADIAKQFIGQMAVIDLSKLDALASRIGTLGNDLVTA